PDVVVIEDLLPVFAKQGSTNRATGHLLGGLHGVVKLAVHQRRLPIEVVSGVDVRRHFLAGNFTRRNAKRYTIDKRRALGWPGARNGRRWRIEVVSVGDARRRFRGGNSPRRNAKRYTIDKCRALGWAVAKRDEDAADACALWSYWCAQVAPETAIRVSPLFRR